jgi:hypothetical protein
MPSDALAFKQGIVSKIRNLPILTTQQELQCESCVVDKSRMMEISNEYAFAETEKY